MSLTCNEINLKLQFVEGQKYLRERRRENARERDDSEEDGWDMRSKGERIRASGGCKIPSLLRSAIV